MYIPFRRKIEILEKLLKAKKPSILLARPTVIKRLHDLNKLRNKFDHWPPELRTKEVPNRKYDEIVLRYIKDGKEKQEKIKIKDIELKIRTGKAMMIDLAAWEKEVATL